MAVGLEQIPGGAIAQICAELLGQLRQDRHVPALATLGFRNEEHLLVEVEVLGFDVGKLRDPGPGLEEGLHEQAAHTAHAVGILNEPPFLIAGETCHDSLSLLRLFEDQRASDFFRHIARLIIGEMMLPPEFLGGGDDRFEARK
jgi:hypothetical protein